MQVYYNTFVTAVPDVSAMLMQFQSMTADHQLELYRHMRDYLTQQQLL